MFSFCQTKGRAFLFLGAVLAATLLSSKAFACNVPVFRYALEKWHPGPHEVVIVYEGELTSDQQRAVALLRKKTNAEPPEANFYIELVNLEKNPPKEFVVLYKQQREKQLPLMMVRFPAITRISAPYWTGALTVANVNKILQSPLRQTVADRVLKGHTAIWLLLESGNKDKDTAAGNLLEKEFRRMENLWNLPDGLAEMFATVPTLIPNHGGLFSTAFLGAGINQKRYEITVEKLEGPVLPLKVKFSLLRLKRNNPAEDYFLKMLLNTEEDLKTFDEPMVFPIFGRGRALYALIGKGINVENIRVAGRFLTGPCTCTVKDQNPGTDLLISTDWEKGINSRFVQEKALPPLTGLSEFLPPKGKTKKSIEEK